MNSIPAGIADTQALSPRVVGLQRSPWSLQLPDAHTPTCFGEQVPVSTVCKASGADTSTEALERRRHLPEDFQSLHESATAGRPSARGRAWGFGLRVPGAYENRYPSAAGRERREPTRGREGVGGRTTETTQCWLRGSTRALRTAQLACECENDTWIIL